MTHILKPLISVVLPSILHVISVSQFQSKANTNVLLKLFNIDLTQKRNKEEENFLDSPFTAHCFFNELHL